MQTNKKVVTLGILAYVPVTVIMIVRLMNIKIFVQIKSSINNLITTCDKIVNKSIDYITENVKHEISCYFFKHFCMQLYPYCYYLTV